MSKKDYRVLQDEYYNKVYPKDKYGVICIDFTKLPFRTPKYGDRWGEWEYCDDETLVCEHYEVDLDRMKSSAAVLDWIIQVSHKTWATPRYVSNLVYALDDILRLQENYCSFGMEIHNK